MSDAVSINEGRHTFLSPLIKLVDLLVTLLLWSYFTVGFVVFFAPFYIVATLLASDRAQAFQRLNHYFYRGFFRLCRLTMPRLKIHIDPALADVHSAVIVCNHISYIDPLLMISLFSRHTTIVKARLFHIPVFGWMLKMSGYLPAESKGSLAEHMVKQMERMQDFLADGGNLFVFPEGTRSRDGTLGAFNPGAFKIAKLCRAPLAVVRIVHSDRLFTPGRFLFNACGATTITVQLLDMTTPNYDRVDFSSNELIGQVRSQLESASHADTVDIFSRPHGF